MDWLRYVIHANSQNVRFFQCKSILQTDDQLFPVYVMQTIGKYRGIPGLFIAGIFGAALR